MGRLDGRTVLVTGATSGIGRAIATRCAVEGANVLATGRDEAGLAQLAQEYTSIAVHPADLTEADAADGCAAAAVGRFGRLDGLAHAAGIVRRGEDIRNTTDQQWSLMRNINLDATFRLARACLREMVPQRSGSVVLVGSQLAQVGAPGYASYCAVKGGVSELTRIPDGPKSTASARTSASTPPFTAQ